MKKVAIYYRVSTDQQEFQSQKHTVEQWISELSADKRPTSIQVFQDKGISGNTTERPQYQKMLSLAFSKKIDTVIVYRLDRMSRNAKEALHTLLALDEMGVGFISVTQPVLNLGHDNPFRRTMLAAFAEIADIERQTIVERVKSGLEAARSRGVRLGAPLRASEEEKLRVQELRDQGWSYRKIATETGLSYGLVYNLVNPDSNVSITREEILKQVQDD